MFYQLQQQLSGWIKRSRVRKTRRNRRLPRLGQAEGLESRRVLAFDVSVTGDCDLNGTFDTADLVQAFQHGKFESDSPATWDQGDWNGDGRFNSADLVSAFQKGSYNKPGARLAALVAVDDNSDPTGLAADETAAPTEPGMPVVDDGSANHQHGDLGFARLRKMIEALKSNVENGGDLPGNMTAEEVTNMITGLEAAMAAGDKSAIESLLNRVKEEAIEERVQKTLDQLKRDLASNNLPKGVTPEQAQSAIDGLSAAIEAGKIDAALEIIKGLRKSISDADDDDKPGDDNPGHGGDDHGNGDHGDATTPEQVKARIQAGIDALQAAVDADKLPAGVTKEYALDIIAAARSALEAGDTGVALRVLNKLHQAAHDARDDDKPGDDGDDDDATTPEQVKAQIQARIDALQAAVDADKLPAGATKEMVLATIEAAKAAASSGDLKGALDAFHKLHEAIHDARDDDKPGNDNPGDDSVGHHGIPHGEVTPEQLRDRVLAHLDALQAAVDADKLPAGVTKEQVVAVITKARTLLEAGDAGIALGTISKFYQAIHDAREDNPGDDKPGDHGDGRDDHGQVTPDKIKTRVQAAIDSLQAAVDADKLPTGATKEQVVAAIAAAKTALEAGDIGAALGVLNKLHQAIHDAREDQPGDDRGDEEDDRDDDRDDDVRPEPPLPPVVEPAVQGERSGRGDRR